MGNIVTPETTNGLFALAGVALGGGIGFVSALLTIRYQNRRDAAVNLRSAFIPILSRIRSIKLASESDIRTAALASFDNHAIELERFRFYVGDSDIAAYNQACEEYNHMLSLRPLNHGSPVQADKFYVDKVNAILDFAKP